MIMTEAEALDWVGKNWPTLVLVVTLVKAYLKIRAFPLRLKRLEQRVVRLLDVCAKQHGDQALFLLKDEEKEE